MDSLSLASSSDSSGSSDSDSEILDHLEIEVKKDEDNLEFGEEVSEEPIEIKWKEIDILPRLKDTPLRSATISPPNMSPVEIFDKIIGKKLLDHLVEHMHHSN